MRQSDAIVFLFLHDFDKQLKKCRAYCDLYGFEIIEVTRDRDYAVQESLGSGATLVTTSVTNLGTTLAETAEAIRDVPAVVCIDEGIDSTTAIGRCVLHVIASVEDYYRATYPKRSIEQRAKNARL